MKYSLLDIVQKTLSYLDDFNVNAIDETEEAEQVVTITNHIYNDIVTSYPWPFLRQFVELETTAVANEMRLPDEVLGIDWIRYNKQDVKYISPKEMQEKLDGRDTTLATVDSNGALNDTDPRYWTSIDDQTIIFDGYNSSLVGANSKCQVLIGVAELTQGTQEPVLPERFHPVLLHGVIAEGCRVMKGDVTQGQIYDRKYRDGLNKMKRWARRVNGVETTMPNDYGRKNTANIIQSRTVIEG